MSNRLLETLKDLRTTQHIGYMIEASARGQDAAHFNSYYKAGTSELLTPEQAASTTYEDAILLARSQPSDVAVREGRRVGELILPTTRDLQLHLQAARVSRGVVSMIVAADGTEQKAFFFGAKDPSDVKLDGYEDEGGIVALSGTGILYCTANVIKTGAFTKKQRLKVATLTEQLKA